MNHRPARVAALVASALLATAGSALGADIDIYGAPGSAGAPNVLFFLDNTANWSNQSQAWTPGSNWDKCKNLSAEKVTACKAAIEEVFYVGKPASEKRPWQSGFKEWNSSQSPTQGQVELRALRLVLKSVVCEADPDEKLDVNVGLSMFSPDKGSVLSSGHPTAFIYQAVKPLTGDASSGTCKQILDKLDAIDKNITSPSTKAPQDANYGAALYEAFKYFGGYTNPTLAAGATSTAGSPTGGAAYGPLRHSVPQALDDPNAFVSGNQEYKSPLDDNASCGNSYLVLVGNTYPKAEPKSGPLPFQGLGYTPPTLSPVTSDTGRYGDEWSYFLANTDIHESAGIQRLYSYHVNVYNDKPDTDQNKLMKSMAAVGGVGSSGYVEVGGDLLGLIEAFKSILLEIAAVNSVFTATTLPVSTTTQGTYLNQVFVGMFRPDAKVGPRWVGNVKQYQLGFVNGKLDMLDAKNQPAVLAGAGFFSPLAESFWTEDSVFFAQMPMGTPPSKSDRPDGPIVEKGGAAQMLRKANLQNAGARKMYTLPASPPAAGTALSSKPFSGSNGDVTSSFSAAEIAWVRGEANMTTDDGKEDFVGTYLSGTTETLLGSTGARHSIHGDVLHARPVALNYGNGDVVVYYGANDGVFRAVDGRKTGSGAGSELWSFVAPEHYAMLKRQRAGLPKLHLPETNEAGGTVAPADGTATKDYAMDGPIGVYARYASGGASVTEAIIYPAMRRGGKAVYAFDVTAKDNPKFLWKITGGSGTYAKLAQTWSMPKPVLLKSNSSTPPVLLVMGGGYDPAEDANNSTGIGNVIYFINGRTGDLIKALETEYSVPSDVTVIDKNEDGQPDRAYVADVRGNLYRVDFPTTGDLLDSASWATTEAVKIAELEGKVFYPPDAVATKNFIAVMVGTGDREKPLLVSTSDNFFLVKDNVDAAAPTLRNQGNMTRVARIDNTSMLPVDVINPVADEPEGCYLQLATNGEKVVNAPFTIAGTTYFGTNRPKPSNPNICSADLGEAYAYKFPLFCGVPTSNQIVGGGLPPSPVGGIVELEVDGVKVKVPFIIGGGEDGSPFKPGEPKPPIPPLRTRLNWRIDNGNR